MADGNRIALARIGEAAEVVPRTLTKVEKAAVIVRLMLAEGGGAAPDRAA